MRKKIFGTKINKSYCCINGNGSIKVFTIQATIPRIVSRINSVYCSDPLRYQTEEPNRFDVPILCTGHYELILMLQKMLMHLVGVEFNMQILNDIYLKHRQ